MKLVGIRINKGTADSVKKNLEQEWYPFLNDYYFEDKDITDLSNEQLLEKIKSKNVSDCELYTTEKTGPDISVHAIVGKNGSGKSTILEILFRIINNFAKKNLRRYKTDSAELIYADEISAILFYCITENNIDKFYYLSCDIKKDSNSSKTELYNENGKIECAHTKMVKSELKLYLENFFYSIVVNYSHYSLNILEVANLKSDKTRQMETEEGLLLYLSGNKPAEEHVYKHWLNGLFHKNDGYLTPVTINPMRTKGNFDVNRERNLSLQRLFGLLVLRPQFLTEYDAQKICVDFKLKTAIEDKIYDQSGRWKRDQQTEVSDFYNQDYIAILSDLYNYWCKKIISKKYKINKMTDSKINSIDHLISRLQNMTPENAQLQTALLYMAYKTIAIVYKYEGYSFDNGVEKLVDKIIREETHITLKIRQCIYHIENRLLKGDYISVDWQEIKITDFDTTNKNVDEIFEQLYPPIYKTDICLKNNKTSALVYFKDMSSGERQMLCSISSVLYHLINLQSVDENKVKYKHINVILDEVEMYYHPEYQRQFINKLLTLINGLKLDKKKIKSINICVVTHSPFLLSDIVKNNILFLKEGKVANSEVKTETFGANLYDLMLNGFFLENTFGEFSFNTIQKEVIDKINAMERIDEKEFEKINNIINIIGDSFYKKELKRMLLEKTDKTELKKMDLEKQLEKIQSQLNQLNQEKEKENDTDTI